MSSSNPRNVKLTLQYDGAAYLGWQKTPHGPSIEEELQKALFQLFQTTPSIQAASRTDRGVHAEGQVVNFLLYKEVSLEKLMYTLNRLIPEDIRVTEISDVPMTFHPSLNCVEKEYHYLIENTAFQNPFSLRYAWHVPKALDLSAMKQGAEQLIGSFDFSALTNQNASMPENRVRKIHQIDIIPLENSMIRFQIKGTSFLYKMVRNIVGTLVYVGLGKIPSHEVQALVSKKKRILTGVTAPAHGLILKKVTYS